MNFSEYETFEGRLFDAFPHLVAWMQAAGDGTRGLWIKAMRGPNLQDALNAIDSVFCGDEEYPKANSDLPKTICRICRETANRRNAQASTRRRFVDGQQTYACRFCLDTGLVEIVHPKTVALARTQPHSFLDHAALYSGMAACTCAAGDRWHANSGCVRYREDAMPLLSDLSRGVAEVPQGSLASFVRAALGDGRQRKSARGDHTQTLQFEEKCRLIEWLEAHGVASGQGQAWNPDFT